VFQQREGVVAVRGVWTPRVGEPPPVDLEIVWWSAVTGKVTRRTLPKNKPFTPQRYGTLGDAHIVDGGAVFQATRSEPVHFFRDDGKKDETFTMPQNVYSLANAARIGDRWLLATFSSGTARLTFSEANGDKWTTKIWRLDEGAVLQLVDIAKKPYVAFHVSVGALPTMYTVGLVPLDTIGDDPPAGVIIPPSAADVACDAQASTYRATASTLTPGSRGLQAHIDMPDKTSVDSGSYERLAHPTSAGGYCASVYHLSNDTYVFAEPKGFSGVRFKRVPDPKDATKTTTVSEPLACTPKP
jgi:hypothetical protein